MVWSTIYDNNDAAMEGSPTKSLPFQMTAGFAELQLEHRMALDIYSCSRGTRGCGIICTIGPASKEVPFLVKMMETGMNIARLNFSHGSHEYHAETIKNVRDAQAEYSKKLGMQYPCAIALDTKGPEIRTGLLEGGGSAEVELKTGGTIKMTTDKSWEDKGTIDMVYVDYSNIQNVLQPGNRIFIDDGLMSLVVKSVDGNVLTCEVENGGKLGSRKGVNLPGTAVDLPAVSEKDRGDFKFGIEQGVDMIFASFIRDAAGVNEIRKILGKEGQNILIISKIENHQGIVNIDEIIDASDGIMVARGDMGIEIPTEKVFIAQKAIIAKCNKIGKPIICATQMLESMTYKPRPTRAEASDVANAVIDGADCTMLSGESAKGLYPLECVRTMADICKEAEAVQFQRSLFNDLIYRPIKKIDPPHTIAISAVEASIKCIASAIVVATACGQSAHLISRYRPKCPVVAVTKNAQAARQCHLYRGIMPLHYTDDQRGDWLDDLNARITFGINFGKGRGFIKIGDPVIIVSSFKEEAGFTNSMKIIYVTDADRYTA